MSMYRSIYIYVYIFFKKLIAKRRKLKEKGDLKKKRKKCNAAVPCLHCLQRMASEIYTLLENKCYISLYLLC